MAPATATEDPRPPTTLPRLLTAAEVHEQTGIPLATVYELTRRGELPAVRVGSRSYRYSAPAIREWVEEGGARDGDAA